MKVYGGETSVAPLFCNPRNRETRVVKFHARLLLSGGENR